MFVPRTGFLTPPSAMVVYRSDIGDDFLISCIHTIDITIKINDTTLHMCNIKNTNK